MVHGDTVRWEEGANREVEAGSGEACGLCRDIGAVVPDTANYVIQIACQFDQTDTTQLALMVPKDLVQVRRGATRSMRHAQCATPSTDHSLLYTVTRAACSHSHMYVA